MNEPADRQAAAGPGPSREPDITTPLGQPTPGLGDHYRASGPVSAEPADGALSGAERDVVTDAQLAAQLEALLVVTDGPLAVSTAAEATASSPERVSRALVRLRDEYHTDRRGFRVRQTAEGWALHAAPEHHDVVRRAVVDQQPSRLSAAALETLAVVAYRQPVTRGQVAAIRGVGVDAVMRTLLSRGLIDEQGADPSTGAILYRTSTEFLDRLGIRSLDELPDLGQYMPDIESIGEETP